MRNEAIISMYFLSQTNKTEEIDNDGHLAMHKTNTHEEFSKLEQL